MRIFLALAFLAVCVQIGLAQSATGAIRGVLQDQTGKPLAAVTAAVQQAGLQSVTDEKGVYSLENVPVGAHTLVFTLMGYEMHSVEVTVRENATEQVNITLRSKDTELQAVEVFGRRNEQPKGLEAITRMPLKPSDQIQSISVISNVVIEEQGALTVTDAARNVPGVTLFSSYGGVRESMAIRGYRGTPVLKNGVRMDSQFQTAAMTTDMQGVESIQVIKGSAAITQGVITDIGNAGGVINVVTKTPQFINAGEVGLRVGSWGQVRPTFDIQNVLDKNRSVAIRLNGSFERADNYRPVVNSTRVYINPSVEWRPDDKTSLILEADYMNDSRTPVTSTINLGPISEQAIYELPNDRFLGLENDVTETKTFGFSARMNRKISEKLSVRAAFIQSDFDVDATSTASSTVVNNQYNLRRRVLSRSLRDDNNSVVQLDLVGQDVKTGFINHTFQAGFDYRIADATTTSLGSTTIDTINVFEPISNKLNKRITFTEAAPVLAYYSTYGLMAQDVVTFNRYVKAILGVRYSNILNKNGTSISEPRRNAWNPSLGIMVTPVKNLNVFGSFTSSTSLRSAGNLLSSGEEIGPSNTEQFEVGIKSDWLNNRLRFNFTYFDIITRNLSNTEYVPGTDQTTGYYFKAGDLKRKGVEVELNGRVLDNLQVMLGYAYLDAFYDNSPSYVNGSVPMNAPRHTANAWANYAFKGVLNGLSLGFGVYYVGDRPVNEYSLSPDGHGNPGGEKPFDMPAYTTLNAQVGYRLDRFTLRVYLNNIADEIGYNSYFRGGFINQIDPRNISAAVSYRF